MKQEREGKGGRAGRREGEREGLSEGKKSIPLCDVVDRSGSSGSDTEYLFGFG